MEGLKQLITQDDNWIVGEGENEGTPFILRYRSNLQPFIDTGKYYKGLAILWSYETDNSSLVPDDEDMTLMEKVEDSLVEALEHDLQAVLAFVFTGQNQREWHWYSTDMQETGRRLNEALSKFDELPLELIAEDDPEWSEYNAVLDGADNDID